MLTFDVRIHSIRVRQGRRKPYELRWQVGPRPHSKSFTLKPQADGRRSELMSALRKGEQFDVDTGLPASELAALNTPTWYAHACGYALMKWPKIAAKHRASIADALSTVTPALVSSRQGMPEAQVLRQALYGWVFRMARGADGKLAARKDVEPPPPSIAQALAWLEKHSLQLTDAARPVHLRAALDALLLKLDGTPAADNTVRRKRMVLSNTLRYAVELELLPSNPLTHVDWETPQTDDEVDFRYVPNPEQARALLRAVREQGPRGEHLEAFFGCLYYAAMRPSEIAILKKQDCRLPDSGWGELLLAASRPEVATGWTDDGKPYEDRGLKRRARKTVRPVPIPPVLVQLLQNHLEALGTAPDGRLFRAARGGRVRSTEYSEVWEAARHKALSPEDATSPLAAVPYALRHAGISLWIKAGVDPVEVARRAGHSLAVLYRFYARLLRGVPHQANRLIEAALTEADTTGEGQER